MLRLAHVSDVHLFCPEARWEPEDLFTRRVTGWINMTLMRRGRKFRRAAEVLGILVEDIYSRRPDALIFSGDATSLAFEEEFALTAKLLRINDADALPTLAVPGNHDYYTRFSAAQGLFERHFARGLEGERVDDSIYPFARKIGPLWLIGVNSCTGNSWFWDATGRVGKEQLNRLRQLLALPHIAASPRVLVTHYPIGLASGKPEKPWHNLRDLAAVLEVAQEAGVALWLHGHRHHAYHLPATPKAPIPSICSGSGTQKKLWTYNEYAFDGDNWQVERRRYDAKHRRFVTVQKYTVELAGLASQPVSIT
jgi:3',5'-cyclic AMP phosphodiesterase CpdA